MEAREFEHIVSGRFKGFGSHAPSSVWEGIEAHLDSKKRRAGIFWWISSVLALITIGATLAVQLNNSPKTEINQAENTLPVNSEHDSATQNTSDNLSNPEKSKISSTSNSPETSLISNNATTNESAWENRQDQTKRKTSSIVEISNSGEETINRETIEFEKLPVHDIYTGKQLRGLDFPIASPPFVAVSRNNPFRVGIEIGTFVNLSKPRTYSSYEPTNPSFSEFSSNSITQFQRQFEVEAFIARGNRSRFIPNARVLYARSQSSVSADSTDSETTRNYLGLGIGSDFVIHGRKFRWTGFATARWEYVLGSLDSPQSSVPTALPTGDITYSVSRFNQHVVSAEVGIQATYNFDNNFALFGALSYRNYFWQQEPGQEPITRIPHLLRFGVGASLRLP